MEEKIEIPRYYRPWPHQIAAWRRRASGKYTYYFKLWARQAGKDTDDIQWLLRRAWDSPGTQSAYIGLDNVWINNNIFKKYIDGRTHWMDYPEEYINVKDTSKEVYLTNNERGEAPARIKFIGFLNDEGLIGSSYDNFVISEASLYSQNAFSYIRPIWDRKIAMASPLTVNFNGTPRGMHNVMYDLMRVYSGVDDPADFPGDHGNCYIDKVTIADILVPDGHGGYKPLYTESEIEKLKSQYLREFGDLNFYRQENECDFTTVNSGLVYRGIEQLEGQGRFTPYNLDTSRPVYVAWDISSKAKITDATAAIIFQYYDGRMIIYDTYESRGMSLIQCVQDLASREYFHLIRLCALPWDSERSASSETPAEECARAFPNITWHTLDKERVDRGINIVRDMLQNMIINSENCEWLMECFHNYEYKRLEKADDWAARPKHTRHSHLMDALRYAAMAVRELDYLQLNDAGQDLSVASTYAYMYDDEPSWKLPITYQKRERDADKRDDGSLVY